MIDAAVRATTDHGTRLELARCADLSWTPKCPACADEMRKIRRHWRILDLQARMLDQVLLPLRRTMAERAAKA